MGWSIGYSDGRDIGYGVPAECDHPKCHEKIDRGLSYVCAGQQPYGVETGCGMFFCSKHLLYGRPGGPHCPRCGNYKPPYKHRKPDIPEWLNWKLTDESWQRWRDENPDKVEAMQEQLKEKAPPNSDGACGYLGHMCLLRHREHDQFLV